MEYPNIVFLAREFYGQADAEILDYLVVHETAHQWWYGVVGNNQVTEAWLDEGLTEFSTVLFFEKVRGRGQDCLLYTSYCSISPLDIRASPFDHHIELGDSSNSQLSLLLLLLSPSSIWWSKGEARMSRGEIEQ